MGYRGEKSALVRFGKIGLVIAILSCFLHVHAAVAWTKLYNKKPKDELNAEASVCNFRKQGHCQHDEKYYQELKKAYKRSNAFDSSVMTEPDLANLCRASELVGDDNCKNLYGLTSSLGKVCLAALDSLRANLQTVAQQCQSNSQNCDQKTNVGLGNTARTGADKAEAQCGQFTTHQQERLTLIKNTFDPLSKGYAEAKDLEDDITYACDQIAKCDSFNFRNNKDCQVFPVPGKSPDYYMVNLARPGDSDGAHRDKKPSELIAIQKSQRYNAFAENADQPGAMQMSEDDFECLAIEYQEELRLMYERETVSSQYRTATISRQIQTISTGAFNFGNASNGIIATQQSLSESAKAAYNTGGGAAPNNNNANLDPLSMAGNAASSVGSGIVNAVSNPGLDLAVVGLGIGGAQLANSLGGNKSGGSSSSGNSQSASPSLTAINNSSGGSASGASGSSSPSGLGNSSAISAQNGPSSAAGLLAGTSSITTARSGGDTTGASSSGSSLKDAIRAKLAGSSGGSSGSSSSGASAAASADPASDPSKDAKIAAKVNGFNAVGVLNGSGESSKAPMSLAGADTDSSIKDIMQNMQAMMGIDTPQNTGGENTSSDQGRSPANLSDQEAFNREVAAADTAPLFDRVHQSISKCLSKGCIINGLGNKL